MVVHIHSRAVFKAVLLVVGMLVGLHILSVLVGERSWQMTRLFHLERESSVPAWFSSMMWALGALAALGCSTLASARVERRTWGVLACGLLLLSCDEVAMLHENLGTILRQRVIGHPTISLLDLPWMFALPLFAAIGYWLWLALGRCLASSPIAKRWLLTGVALLIGGAMSVDMTSDALKSAHTAIPTVMAHIMLVLEETLELLGSLCVLMGLLTHQQVLSVRLQNGARAP